MRRVFIATLTLFMLLLAAALAGLWARSYHAKDRLIWNRPVHAGNSSSSIELASSRGRLCLSWDRLVLVGPAPAVARHMAEPYPFGIGWKWLVGQPADGLEFFEPESFWTRLGFGFHAMRKADIAPSPMSGIVASYDRTRVQIPIWLAVALAGIPSWGLVRAIKHRLRKHRRLAANLCLDCGYDMRATPERCPECGKVVGAVEPSKWRAWRWAMALAAAANVLLAGGIVTSLCRVEKFNWPPRYSWVALRPDTYEDGDADKLRALDDVPQWFMGNDRPATQMEFDVFQARCRSRKITNLMREIEQRDIQTNDPDGFDVEQMPQSNLKPREPQDIHLEDQGVRVALDVRRGDEQTYLNVRLSLFSQSNSVKRTEAGWRSLPFLFAFEVDGKPTHLPLPNFYRGDMRQNGRVWCETLVEAGGRRDWTLRVDEAALRQMLPNQGPHTLNIIAVFSQRDYWELATWEGWGFPTFSLDYEQMNPVFPILVRSNAARIRWTGSKWETLKDQ